MIDNLLKLLKKGNAGTNSVLLALCLLNLTGTINAINNYQAKLITIRKTFQAKPYEAKNEKTNFQSINQDPLCLMTRLITEGPRPEFLATLLTHAVLALMPGIMNPYNH